MPEPDLPPPREGKVLRDYPANLDGLLKNPVQGGAVEVPASQVAYSPPPQPEQPPQSFGVNGRPQQDETHKPFKPYPFALKKSAAGFRIWPGRLFSSINQLQFSADGTFQDQAGIDIPKVDYPANMDVGPDYESTEFAWNGDVYAYWETDGAGVVQLLEIRGPGTPATNSLPLDGVSGDDGKFYVKIGTVPAGAGEITQIVGSDIYWMGAFVEQDSGSSGGNPSDPGGSGSSSGSDKSTAIVPAAWSPTGFVALFIAEMPEVRFDDVVKVTVRGRRQTTFIDHRFAAVCEPGSIVLCGSGTDNGRPARVWLEERMGRPMLVLRTSRLPWLRPKVVHVRLSGVRKGFVGKRFPNRTHAQFEANEAFINSAYPGS